MDYRNNTTTHHKKKIIKREPIKHHACNNTYTSANFFCCSPRLVPLVPLMQCSAISLKTKPCLLQVQTGSHSLCSFFDASINSPLHQLAHTQTHATTQAHTHAHTRAHTHTPAFRVVRSHWPTQRLACSPGLAWAQIWQ